LKEAKFLYNKLGFHNGYHLQMESLPVGSSNAPVLTVQGNAFYWGGSPTNYVHFMPVVTNWTNLGQGYGWNNPATNQYYINNPTEYADTNLFSRY
jgi:hypothetical protein